MSSLLVVAPSFWDGWARLMDFGDTLTEYNLSPSPEYADSVALWHDWVVVGEVVSFV